MKILEPFPHPVYVSQPLLPDIDALQKMIQLIWESNQLTNNGNMVRQLEKELAVFLNAPYLSLISNGTIALHLACKALRLSGEVITTPFTFAATPHALAWNGIKPVFCDIEEDTFNMNPDLIEPLITQETTAILPVHVFGKPCKVKDIRDIAERNDLKILYDAAHAFGVKIGGEAIASFGDISMFSLHATKIYHTVEGGALAFNRPYLKERIDSLKNFGIEDEGNVREPGTNGKLNELQAAVGILLLDKVEAEIARRKEITGLYRQLLKDIPGIQTSQDMENVTHNYPYFVIRVEKKEFGRSRDELYEKLKAYNVITRKYFYPLCSNFSCYSNLSSAAKDRLPVANKVAETVLALPIYGKLPNSTVEKICAIIKGLS